MMYLSRTISVQIDREPAAVRLPGMSDEGFAEDAALVEKDLESLKELLER